MPLSFIHTAPVACKVLIVKGKRMSARRGRVEMVLSRYDIKFVVRCQRQSRDDKIAREIYNETPFLPSIVLISLRSIRHATPSLISPVIELGPTPSEFHRQQGFHTYVSACSAYDPPYDIDPMDIVGCIKIVCLCSTHKFSVNSILPFRVFILPWAHIYNITSINCSKKVSHFYFYIKKNLLIPLTLDLIYIYAPLYFFRLFSLFQVHRYSNFFQSDYLSHLHEDYNLCVANCVSRTAVFPFSLGVNRRAGRYIDTLYLAMRRARWGEGIARL